MAVGFARLTFLAQQTFVRFVTWPGRLAWMPVLGALLCLLIGLARIQGAGGHGVLDVAGITFYGGGLLIRALLTRGFLATLAIGSDLAMGLENPIVRLEWCWVWYGQRLKLIQTQLKTPAVCGAALGSP